MIGTSSISTSPNYAQTTGAVNEEEPVAVAQGAMPPANWIILALGVLIALHYLGVSEGTAIEPAHIFVGGYNAVTITLIAAIGITLLKLIFNRFQVSGLTELINAL
jgi:hypothetical protein